MPPEHVSLYQEYHKERPIDGSREDARHGLLCQLVDDIGAGRKTEIADWIPSFKPHDLDADFEQLAAYLSVKAKQGPK